MSGPTARRKEHAMATGKLSGKRVRDLQRIVHLVSGLLVGLYIYTPLADLPAFSALVQLVVVHQVHGEPTDRDTKGTTITTMTTHIILSTLRTGWRRLGGLVLAMTLAL